MPTNLPGLKSGHAIITPTCRANRGHMEAFDEAVSRLRAAYERYAGVDANAEANWHLALTVERPGEC